MTIGERRRGRSDRACGAHADGKGGGRRSEECSGDAGPADNEVAFTAPSPTISSACMGQPGLTVERLVYGELPRLARSEKAIEKEKKGGKGRRKKSSRRVPSAC